MLRREKALLTRFTSEIGHEVQSQVENDTVHDLVRNVGKSRGDRFGGRMIESITRVLLDDTSLGVENKNLE